MATFPRMLLIKHCYLAMVLYYLYTNGATREVSAGVDVMDISGPLEDEILIEHIGSPSKSFHGKGGFGKVVKAIGDKLVAQRKYQATNYRPTTQAENIHVEEATRVDADITQCSLCEEIVPFPASVSTRHKQVDNLSASRPVSKLPGRRGPDCCRIYNAHADCRDCSLISIPQALPVNTTVLLLGQNSINDEALGPRVFALYPRLELLSLANNNISYFPDEVFEGLSSLRCLCLQNNTIKMDHALNSSRAFQALNKSLIYLKMNKNNKCLLDGDLMYPTNLKYLYLDGIPFKRFENPNQNYRSLTHLTLAGYDQGYCNLTGLRRRAFELESLMYLDISWCRIDGRYVNDSAFENLKHLQTLNLTNNFNLGIDKVGDVMYGLRNNTHFQELVMRRINARFTPCIAVYKNTLRFFQHTGLKTIVAEDNEIEIIEKGALQMLPKTLETLDLSGNKIIFGEYIKDLKVLPQLKVLALDGSRTTYAFPQQYPTQGLRNCVRSSTHIPQSDYQHGTAPVADRDPYVNVISLPPSLAQASMLNTRVTLDLNNITFSTLNNLEIANLSGNIFPHLDGPIRGLHKLKVLHLAESFIHSISYTFFDDFPNLRELSFDQNTLGKTFSRDNDGSILRKLTKLRRLNLSNNGMFRIHALAFKTLHELTHLNLAKNRLGLVNFTIVHMKKLQILDLHGNAIRTLSPRTMAEIDQINEGRRPLRLDLSSNPIGCDCSNFRFLEWLAESGVMRNTFTDQEYFCDADVQLDGYKAVIKQLRQECVTHSIIFIVVLCLTLTLVMFILLSTLYRFRWTLRYWHHVAKLKLHPHLPHPEFDYDVFVSYSNKDDFVEEELVPRLQNDYSLRVQFHGLNFPAGGQIADSIHRAVTSSRKTLVVISKNMLESRWCRYELMTARREGIARGCQVLAFLFLEAMGSWEMSSEVASYVRESTYIAYPPDPAHRPAFWRKLADDLGADMPLS